RQYPRILLKLHVQPVGRPEQQDRPPSCFDRLLAQSTKFGPMREGIDEQIQPEYLPASYRKIVRKAKVHVQIGAVRIREFDRKNAHRFWQSAKVRNETIQGDDG